MNANPLGLIFRSLLGGVDNLRPLQYALSRQSVILSLSKDQFRLSSSPRSQTLFGNAIVRAILLLILVRSALELPQQ